MRPSLIAPVIVLFVAAPAMADPADLKDFGLVCFCTSRVATPHRLVNSGNNGRILMIARHGITRAQIVAAGEQVTGAQLQTLKAWGLLKVDGDRYTTAFPILGAAEVTALRSRLRPIVGELSGKIAPDLIAIQEELKARGQSRSAEAVLFSYVLDGLTWRSLDASHALPTQQIDAAHPYWNGTFWAVYPKQDNMPGTNSKSVGKAELRMMWTPPVLPWFDRITKAPENAVVINERDPDPIYAHGRRAGDWIARYVRLARLDDVIPSAEPKQRVLIATHELIWMLLGRANRDLGFSPPVALKTGAKSIGDVTPLIVVSVKDDKP